MSLDAEAALYFVSILGAGIVFAVIWTLAFGR
jgi:hypothetical protein